MGDIDSIARILNPTVVESIHYTQMFCIPVVQISTGIGLKEFPESSYINLNESKSCFYCISTLAAVQEPPKISIRVLDLVFRYFQCIICCVHLTSPQTFLSKLFVSATQLGESSCDKQRSSKSPEPGMDCYSKVRASGGYAFRFWLCRRYDCRLWIGTHVFPAEQTN